MADQTPASVRRAIDHLIEIEGGFVDDPRDSGGATKFGITQATARAHGYDGPMRDLPRAEAVRIYRETYWTEPGFGAVADRDGQIAYELFDSGVLHGPFWPSVWLQEWLSALNRQGRDYPDLKPDGKIGPRTLSALDAFLALRGKEGVAVLLGGLNSDQACFCRDVTRRRQKDEDFLFGWMRARVVEQFWGVDLDA
jgi:lysozyme family protein